MAKTETENEFEFVSSVYLLNEYAQEMENIGWAKHSFRWQLFQENGDPREIRAMKIKQELLKRLKHFPQETVKIKIK